MEKITQSIIFVGIGTDSTESNLSYKAKSLHVTNNGNDNSTTTLKCVS